MFQIFFDRTSNFVSFLQSCLRSIIDVWTINVHLLSLLSHSSFLIFSLFQFGAVIGIYRNNAGRKTFPSLARYVMDRTSDIINHLRHRRFSFIGRYRCCIADSRLENDIDVVFKRLSHVTQLCRLTNSQKNFVFFVIFRRCVTLFALIFLDRLKN